MHGTESVSDFGFFFFDFGILAYYNQIAWGWQPNLNAKSIAVSYTAYEYADVTYGMKTNLALNLITTSNLALNLFTRVYSCTALCSSSSEGSAAPRKVCGLRPRNAWEAQNRLEFSMFGAMSASKKFRILGVLQISEFQIRDIQPVYTKCNPVLPSCYLLLHFSSHPPHYQYVLSTL
jgi:hypothetical protein